MTLGIGLNIQPFMTACAGLRACMQPRVTVMPSEPFLAAAEALYRSLGEEHLPGFPDALRSDVRQIIECLPTDQLSRVMAGVALSSLREKSLFPPSDVMADPDAVHGLLQALIPPSSPGESAVSSLIKGGVEVHKPVYRATLRGLYDGVDEGDDSKGDTMVFGRLDTDGIFRIARPSRMVRKTASEAEALPPIPIVEIAARTPLPDKNSEMAPEHAAGVNWNAFFGAVKHGRLAPEEPVVLFSEEELYLEVCLEKFLQAQNDSEQAVAAFQENFLASCKDRTYLLGVMLRAVQKGIVPFPMVVQSVFDSLQNDNIPLVDASDSRLLTFRETPLTRGGYRVLMPSRSDYVLGKQIGEGGTSKVYRAHEEGPDRDLAIKIVTIPNAAQRERLFQCFEEERRNQALFSSERFVHVYSTGWTTQGTPYIAMELCDGALTDLLDDIRTGHAHFNLNRALDIARQMVTALAEMHTKDYVHRDIKPDNFFLKNGSVKLGDTGLSQHLDKLPKSPQHEPWGTPGFMPPEVVYSQAPDGKTNDTFAIGVVLYELFTGIFCFDGPTAHAWMINSCQKNPPPPSRVVPGRNIPESIDHLIMKCLEKDPAKRYPDALSILHDLVTARAKALVEEANESRRKSHHTGAEIRIHLDIWRDRMKEALRELRRIYDDFPLPSILQERISLNKELFDWADSAGETEELIAIRDSILALDRELQGKTPGDPNALPFTEAAKAVSQNLQFDFKHDGVVDQRSKPRYDVLTFEERGGYLDLSKRLEPQFRLMSRPVTGRRGPVFGLRFASLDHMPVYLPLPPRPSVNGQPYPARIPTYRLDDFHSDLREKMVIVPSGGASPMRPATGKLAQRVDEVRATNHDIGVLPLPTNLDYHNFLEWVYQQDPTSMARYLPQGWQQLQTGAIVDAHGGAINWKLPITQIDRDQNDAYLEYLSQKYGRSFRNISLFEWKLLCRASDNRVWSWGSALPEKGTVVMRFAGSDNQLEPVDMEHLRDVSPFSVPKIDDKGPGTVNPARSIHHVVGNTFKRLHLTDDEKRRVFEGGVFRSEIRQQYGSDSWANFVQFLKDNDVLAGVAFDQEPTQTPDGLKSRPRDFRGPISFFPVTELRVSDASAWVEALTGQKTSNRPPK